MKKISPSAILALKEALSNIYWRKKDLKSFVYHTIIHKDIISTIDWENNKKIESVSCLIERMAMRQDIYYNDLLAIFDAVINFSDFSHLKYWDDSDSKIQRAKFSVDALRSHAEGYFELKEEKERAIQRKKAYENILREKKDFESKVESFKNDFMILVSTNDVQKRGFLFTVVNLT